MDLNFSKLKSIVGVILGKKEFQTDDKGHLILADEERNKLNNQFVYANGEFAELFENAFNEEVDLKNGGSKDAEVIAMKSLFSAIEKAAKDELNDKIDDVNAALAEMTNLNLANAGKVAELERKLEEAKKQKQMLEQQKGKLENDNKVLAEKTEPDQADEVLDQGQDLTLQPKPFKVNRKHYHNVLGFNPANGTAIAAAEISGFTNKQMGGGASDTIDVSELNEEFGVYISDAGRRLEIFRDILKPIQSRQYMTTKLAIERWRASKAVMTSVVQQFIAKWTPLGQTTMTPLEIVNRRHKVNLPIVPDDITGGWLTHLYDEGVTPDQMPVTKWIVQYLLKDKIDYDIEYLLIATGEYEELADDVAEGDAGQATGKSMDGFLTQLQDQYDLGNSSNMNFFTPTNPFSSDTAIDFFDEFGDWVKRAVPAFNQKGERIFVDPTMWETRNRAYREKYPLTKNDDQGSNKIDDCNFVVTPLENMRGSEKIFCTPKSNFIYLRHKNEASGATKLFLQLNNYEVRIFAEFWLAVGFAIAELVYAYVAEESGSGE